MNHENAVRYTFTHPENETKSIREIARLLEMNPGTVYRILVRLGLVNRLFPQQQHLVGSPDNPDQIDDEDILPKTSHPILANILEKIAIDNATRTLKK